MCAKKMQYDEEELFAHTRMSLGDHIEELRTYMWRAIKGFIVAMVLGFFIAKPVLDFLTAPLKSVIEKMRVDRIEKLKKLQEQESEEVKDITRWVEISMKFKRVDLVRQLKIPQLEQSTDGGEDITLPVLVPTAQLVEGPRKYREKIDNLTALKVFNVTEGFMIWFKVSLYAGFVLASPWIFYQLWMFVAAGMYPHEKKYIHVFLPLSIVLFIAGVCLCQFVVLPKGIEWLLGFSDWLGVEPDLRLSEWLSFALLVPLIFGLAFQLPLVMFAMERIGFLEIETYRSKRRIAIFLIFVISSLANASPDPISMVMLAVPLCVLYEAGILLCQMWPRPELDLDVEESEEMVEV